MSPKLFVCLFVLASKQDYTDCDCLAVAVLTHGEEEVLIGSDGNSIAIKNFVDPIKDDHSRACKTLAGKPKIFIFQVGPLRVIH